jgi:hypothetical protein
MKIGWTTLIPTLAVALMVSAASAGVEKVSNGVKFTYYDPDAGTVYVAGSFNGWNTNATPLVRDEEGNWSAVVSLGRGEHTYKFVVDGGWITDPDNPSTKDDGYGGVNSVIEVNDKGELVDKGRALPISNTLLNSKVFIGGRYLSRTSVEKNVADDPRWRMQRPIQNVDFNFNVTISGLVKGYARLRIDTEDKILQPNNISAYLDEAHIAVTTDQFQVTGFHNEETLRSGDPLTIIGDRDLPGTIFDDHIEDGKGQAGLLFTASRYGVDFQGLASNVHDFDIYNDPNLYDNTGTDVGFGRLSRVFSLFTVGADFAVERNLWWVDFTSRVGTIPANTGIPRLDDYLNNTDDTSDWFEIEDERVLYGADVTAALYEGKLLPQAEVLLGKTRQAFVTGNNSSVDFGNGAIDVPILDRDLRMYHGSVENTQIENVRFNAEHTRMETVNPNADETALSPVFLEDEVSNKQFLVTITPNPSDTKHDYSEFEASWTGTRYTARVWLQRDMVRLEPVVEDVEKAWIYNASIAPGVTATPHERVALELEQRWGRREGSQDLPDYKTIETIVRGSFDLTKTLSAIFDVRHLHLEDQAVDESDDYVAPFAGFKYDPTRKVSVVLAYGVDPLDFDIDYDGRHIGRDNFRRRYLWQNVNVTLRDAEQALADARIVSLRAIFKF